MFVFLNSFLLPLLATSLIPVLLHFLNRQKAKKIQFSSLRFLKVLENQRIKRVKLFQILLILVRSLFIFFLVLAFTRPTVNASFSGSAGNAQTTAVVVLDNSYSMQSYLTSKSYLDIAKESIEKIKSAYDLNDRFFIIFSKNNTIVYNTSDQLKEIGVSNSPYNYNRAFRVADSLFHAFKNINKELFLVSDFTFNLPVDSLHTIHADNLHRYKMIIQSDAGLNNISIDSVVFQNQLMEINKPVNVTVYLRNNSSSKSMETSVNLFSQDERLAMDYATLAPEELKKVDIVLTPKTTGYLPLRVQLDEDDLSYDNTYYLGLSIPDKIRVLYVSDSSDPVINTALKVLQDHTILAIEKSNSNEWQGINPNSFDVLVLDGNINIETSNLQRIQAFLKSGNSIILVPGQNSETDVTNKIYSFLSGHSILAGLNSSGGNSFFSLENEKSANALYASIYRDQKSTFNPPHFFEYYKQQGFSKALIRFSNGDAFLSVTNSRAVNIYTFSSSFATTWSDFSVNGIFLPLLYRVIYLAAQNSVQNIQNARVGEKSLISVKDISLNGQFTLVEPDGQSQSIIPEQSRDLLLFSFGNYTQKGFYTLLNDKKVVQTVAVNHYANEFARNPGKTLDYFKKFREINPFQENIARELISSRIGYELWIIMLILALLMLIIEIALVAYIEGKLKFKPVYERK